ncbi:MAG: NAD(P)/FAD-dependent oxidoreductase [Clostridiales Family XIII bacterium]|jgi:uncharacterized FAD-dependent dehydrogenase|nr:NAD(P)/FAD-dependent oxidoreductase [Clostridiales Family XIII bacterium]
MKYYDIIIVGAGAAGVFASYELTKRENGASVLMIDRGKPLAGRRCPITEGRTERCVKCEPCRIMNGYGGAGSLSDGKYNITTEFGGDLHLYVGTRNAVRLMEYVDEALMGMGGGEAKLYSTASSDLKTVALQNDLHLLDAKVRHLGTDRNVKILGRIYEYTKDRIDMKFETAVVDVDRTDKGFRVVTDDGAVCECADLLLASGRSGSKWMSMITGKFGVARKSNRVDIGVRVELPAEIFKHITDQVYESKIVYKTDKYNDPVRTFCMNPYGEVVTENTNGIITVNGHSYADPSLHTANTNFALLVSNKFTEPFKDSNEYGESIAKLSNLLGGGVLMQRFGDLVKGRRSSEKRMEKCFTVPTLKATPGDLSLVIPKRQLDNIIEMIYALDKIAPGTANEDTLLYGVEVKFYNSEVEVDGNLETKIPGMYALGDASGVTHSLSQASASGVYVAERLAEKYKKRLT